MVFMITVRVVNGNHLLHNSCRESVTMCFERKGNLMPASDIGIDLGTRNSLAYSTGKGLVLNEPSIVVYVKIQRRYVRSVKKRVCWKGALLQIWRSSVPSDRA